MNGPLTLFEKIRRRHLVAQVDDRTELLYVDYHLVNEVTSPQAFEGLHLRDRKVARPDLTLAVAEHNVPTTDRTYATLDADSRKQIETLGRNCAEFGIEYFSMTDPRQGIVHMIGLEQGLTQPGMLVACGDSHTSTHGGLGALGLGIGTSEVEHVLATQTLVQPRYLSMRVTIDGALPFGVTGKDMILYTIGKIGIAGGVGHVIEFQGRAVRDLPIGGRITLCNMSIEAGARSAIIAPDDVVFEYLRGRPCAPKGRKWDAALSFWRTLSSDADAVFDRDVVIPAGNIAPQVTWGTTPEDVLPISSCVPEPEREPNPERRRRMENALAYQGLTPGTPLAGIAIDKAFIGSCTNSSLDDLRAAAAVVRGRRVAAGVQAIVVPGSTQIKREAEAEGLARIFIEAGFEWRESGCSMCLGMNPDRLLPGERCASTTNRNFEHRQGHNGRTHLMSPAMVAAAAVAGRLTDVRTLP